MALASEIAIKLSAVKVSILRKKLILYSPRIDFYKEKYFERNQIHVNFFMQVESLKIKEAKNVCIISKPAGNLPECKYKYH